MSFVTAECYLEIVVKEAPNRKIDLEMFYPKEPVIYIFPLFLDFRFCKQIKSTLSSKIKHEILQMAYKTFYTRISIKEIRF